MSKKDRQKQKISFSQMVFSVIAVLVIIAMVLGAVLSL